MKMNFTKKVTACALALSLACSGLGAASICTTSNAMTIEDTIGNDGLPQLDTYEGTYTLDDSTCLTLKRTGYYTFKGSFSVYRLASFDNLKGKEKNGYLLLKGEDPNGNPIYFKAFITNTKLKLRVAKSTWDLLPKGETWKFTRNIYQ